MIKELFGKMVSAIAGLKKYFPFPGMIIVAVAVVFLAFYLANKPRSQDAIEFSETGQNQNAENFINTQKTPGDENSGPLSETETPQQVIPQTAAPSAASPATSAPAANPVSKPAGNAAANPQTNQKIDSSGAAARDERRQTDMRQIMAAQQYWFTDHKSYVANAGFPAAVGNMARGLADPINRGSVCGRDYVYCGLDNRQNPAKFCYFAKLEIGGYYVVSDNGNFKRDAAPKSFADCKE